MIPIEAWPERLERAAAVAGARWIRRIVVLRETASTQDAARAAGPVHGDFVTAWRQTAGRGRLGRRWLDTGTDGTATSIVLPRMAPERLLATTAVAACRAIEALMTRSTARAAPGIKWPNDILAPDGGKLAGILVECVDDAAIVGIGINVSQPRFDSMPEPTDCGSLDRAASHRAPADCAAPQRAPADRAASHRPTSHRAPRSLAMLGLHADRLEVLEALLLAMSAALDEPLDSIRAAYRERNVLRGTAAVLDSQGRRIEGIIEEVDPIDGIRVRTMDGLEVLPAALTTLAVAPGGLGPT